MNASATTASAKSWKNLAERLEAEATPFVELEGLLADLLYVDPMLAADRAYRAASAAAARA